MYPQKFKSIRILIVIFIIALSSGCANFTIATKYNNDVVKSAKDSAMAEGDSSFNGTIILGRPTLTTMDISILSNEKYDIYFEWGVNSNQYTFENSIEELQAGIPQNIILSDLPQGNKIYYRLLYRSMDQESFKKTQEYSFQLPRASGESFSFVMQSDSHLLNKADTDLYKQSMELASDLDPDFFLDLGDAFLNDQHKEGAEPTAEDVESTYIQQRSYFEIVAKEAPLFLTIGNHEGEYGSFLDGTLDNIAAKSTLARTKYYINPIPNDFYSGNIEEEPLFGAPQNYFAYTWGDALFVSIDPYRYSDIIPYGQSEVKSSGWDWTLGEAQYEWFKNTLEESDAKYKFVLSHHAIGNIRGGANIAHLYEWGGYDSKGKYVFDEMRPKWEKPIQRLMEEKGVTAFFQGHDHLFSREQVGNVTYVTLPKPAEVIADRKSNHSDFPEGDNLMNSGILNVTVNSENVTIDYIRNFLVASSKDEQSTGIVYSFTIDPDRTVEVLTHAEDDFNDYGANEESLDSKNKLTGEDKKNRPKNSDLMVLPEHEMTQLADGGFTFAIQADSHLDEKTDRTLYTLTLENIAALLPSFVIDLGDTSMAEKLTNTEPEAEARYILAKEYLDKLGDVPLFLVTGNHDGENGLGSHNGEMAKWALQNRLKYFPFPRDTEMFSGNVKTANYYSFTKENALFIVLDPYTYTTKKVGQAGGWASTLGETQYNWLSQTLQKNDNDFKFIFIHNLVGGYGKDQRGGAEAAALFEWGGYESMESTIVQESTFAENRSGWEMPIHDLLKTYDVDIVFHGHDHFYAKQEKDGIIYQLVPQPGTPGNSYQEAELYSYTSGTILPSAGFIRVVVSDTDAVVEYVKTGENGDYSIVDSYTIEER